jgi:transcriptional regulator with PAS, ATPase and Fis domain
MAYRLPQDAGAFPAYCLGPVCLSLVYCPQGVHEIKPMAVMIALFQAAINYKPASKSNDKFNQSMMAKWVPVNKSFIGLNKLILRAAVERLGLAHAAITLRSIHHQGHRHLLLVNNERDLQIASAGRVDDFIISTQQVSASPFEDFTADTSVSLPLNFQQSHGQPQRLGYLVAQLAPAVSFSREQIQKELAMVADEIMRTIGRYQTRYRAIHIYGDQHFWVGNSKALRQLDQRIDQLAKGNPAVLIRADNGRGKVIAARSLHCLSRADTAPFIESDCREWEEGGAAKTLQSLHAYANGGTLFLRNIDALSHAEFQALGKFWSRAAATRFDGTYSLRLVMSLSRREVPLESSQSQWLAQNTEELLLPDLSDRRDDVRDLAQFYIREFALSPEFDLTEDAWALLASQPLTSVEELKSLIQTLALRVDGKLISADELRCALA